MKRSRKITAALLAAATVITAASCNSGSGSRDSGSGERTTSAAENANVTTTTLDPNKEFDTQLDYNDIASDIEVDASNEEGAGKNYVAGQKAGEINALCYYEFTDVAPENDILKIFAERFGGTVNVTMCTSLDYYTRLGELIATGDSPDIVRYEWEMIPGGIIQNRFQSLDDWLDIESPVWTGMSDIIEKFAYNGKHYYFPQTMTANYGLIYSTASIEAMGDKDPMDMYFAGEWTWTEFEKLLKDWMTISSDNMGIAIGESSALHLAATAGVAAIEFSGNEIKNNLKSPEITKTMNFVENLAKEGYVWPEWRDPGQGFTDGKLLFYIMPIEWGLNTAMETGWKNNLNGEVRAVPLPRDPDNSTYNILGNCYGYLIPSGAKNVQGAASWILAGRIHENDPEVVKERRDLLLYDGPYYYPKCTKCKHEFENGSYGEENETCPECGEPRKPKFKVTYTPEQMQVLDDMIDPSKFDFLFDQHRGFGAELKTVIIKVFDEPLKGNDTYTHILEENYNVIETTLNEYREMMKS